MSNERNILRTKHNILKEISGSNHITSANISEKLGISYKHTFGIVQEMVKEKLIKKEPNNDKRLWLLSLTDEGKKKLKAFEEIFNSN